MKEEIVQFLEMVRQNNPLVHCITNYVSVNDCANILLEVGASPIMSDDIRDVEEIVGRSSACVLNIGTLEKRTIQSMIKAGIQANKKKIPVILDPVGAGATTYRTATAKKILKKIQVNILRGNISEIKALLETSFSTKGVDASIEDENSDFIKIAQQVALTYHCVVAITGKVDVVSDGVRTCKIANGHSLMAKVTGTGCMLSALVGAFCGANKNNFIATVSAVTIMGIAGEVAFSDSNSNGGGSYRVALHDALSKMDSLQIKEMAKIE